MRFWILAVSIIMIAGCGNNVPDNVPTTARLVCSSVASDYEALSDTQIKYLGAKVTIKLCTKDKYTNEDVAVPASGTQVEWCYWPIDVQYEAFWNDGLHSDIDTRFGPDTCPMLGRFGKRTHVSGDRFSDMDVTTIDGNGKSTLLVGLWGSPEYQGGGVFYVPPKAQADINIRARLHGTVDNNFDCLFAVHIGTNGYGRVSTINTKGRNPYPHPTQWPNDAEEDNCRNVHLLGGYEGHHFANHCPNGFVPQAELGGFVMSTSCRCYGDFDQDNDADLSDFSLLSLCFNGPLSPYPYDDCVLADSDLDGDVDIDDFAVFVTVFNGSAHPIFCR